MDEAMYYLLVDPRGKVYAKAGAESFADVAHEFGLQEYRFDLAARRLLVGHATPASPVAAQDYVNQCFGDPERLMTFAKEGHLPKHVLVRLLSIENRQPYLESCARVEREYTKACTNRRDPCLESGCSVEGEDEVCLQALLDAGVEYHQACAAEWIKLFRTPVNRIDAWKN
jgi:hypothetical protein